MTASKTLRSLALTRPLLAATDVAATTTAAAATASTAIEKPVRLACPAGVCGGVRAESSVPGGPEVPSPTVDGDGIAGARSSGLGVARESSMSATAVGR